MRYRAPVLFAAMFAAACLGDSTPTQPGLPSAEVALSMLDGTNGGNDHLYFLPPLAPEPSLLGSFDESLPVVVEICDLNAGGCELGVEPLARFTRDGPDADYVRVDEEEFHYIVTWRTSKYDVAVGRSYRVRVLVGGLELGYVELLIVDPGAEAGDPRHVALGQAVPVKFWIQQGAVHLATISLGEGVPEVLRDRVAFVTSALGVVPLAYEFSLAVPESPFRSLVFALDDGGTPLLAAFAQHDLTVTLDATSTAEALATTLAFMFGMESDLAAVSNAVTQQPGMPDLARQVQAILNLGDTYLDDDVVLELAAVIAAEAVAEGSTEASPNLNSVPAVTALQPDASADSQSLPVAERPLQIEDPDGDDDTALRISNLSFIYWLARANGGDWTLVPPVNLCIFCWPPLGLAAFASVDLPGVNGSNTVVTAQSAEGAIVDAQWANAARGSAKIIGSAFALAGFWLPDTRLEEFMATIGTVLDIETIVAVGFADGPLAWAEAVVGQLATNSILKAIAGVYFPDERALDLVANAVLSTLLSVEGVATLVTTAGFISDWYALADLPPVITTVCQAEGRFVPCEELRPTRIEIDPTVASLRIPVDGSMRVAVKVYDGAGRELSDLPIQWETGNSAIAVVSPSAGSSTTVFALREGNTYVLVVAGDETVGLISTSLPVIGVEDTRSLSLTGSWAGVLEVPSRGWNFSWTWVLTQDEEPGCTPTYCANCRYGCDRVSGFVDFGAESPFDSLEPCQLRSTGVRWIGDPPLDDWTQIQMSFWVECGLGFPWHPGSVFINAADASTMVGYLEPGSMHFTLTRW